jgi:ATP-dependent Clp protease ATP-binding subunit ClpB
MYGARPLRRAIQRYIENPLSKRILSGEFKENDTIVVDSVDDELVFTRSESKVKTAV